MEEPTRPRFTVQPPGAPSPSGMPLRPPPRYPPPSTCACGQAVVRSWPVRAGGREVGRIWTCDKCQPAGSVTIEAPREKGKFEEEYLYAEQNPTLPACATLLAAARLYARKADAPTLGIIEGAAADVRRLMNLSEESKS